MPGARGARVVWPYKKDVPLWLVGVAILGSLLLSTSKDVNMADAQSTGDEKSLQQVHDAVVGLRLLESCTLLFSRERVMIFKADQVCLNAQLDSELGTALEGSGKQCEGLASDQYYVVRCMPSIPELVLQQPDAIDATEALRILREMIREGTGVDPEVEEEPKVIVKGGI